jgi:hypothetical protein
VGGEVIFAKSLDRALFGTSREVQPRHFSAFPIQKWPAADPTLGHYPPYAEFVAWHVRRIYKKEEVKDISNTGSERIWLEVLMALGVRV